MSPAAAAHSLSHTGSDPDGIRVLAVDDDPELTEWYKAFLEPRGFDVRTATDGRTAELLFSTFQPHVVLLDLMLPDVDGEQLMKQLLESAPDTQVVIVSGHATVSRAVSAMSASAFHVVEKPASAADLLAIIERATATRRIAARRDAEGDVERLGRMVTRSPRMKPVFELIETAAPTDASVLILGENGSGKELVANAIHELSKRRNGTFVRINCAAIPAELLESELFGHRRGAFTGADSDRRGLLELAHGGSVLLDEIAEMSPALQVKLLRVLQDREIRAVGSTRPVKVNFRLICATNVEPKAAIADGRLREDLFFRINTIAVRLPALRERQVDIPLLAQHFLDHFAAEHGKVLEGFHEAAMQALLRYDWPGNVRELEHTIERAVILSRGRHIALSDLPESLRKRPGRQASRPRGVPFGCTLEELERLAILHALELTNWNKRATAQMLGIHRPTLYSKLRKHGLSRSAGEAKPS